MNADELWEALKQVAGANRDKSQIKTLVQIKRSHCQKAVEIINSRSQSRMDKTQVSET